MERHLKPDRPQMARRVACWIIKATDTHSEYVIQNGYGEASQRYFYTYVAGLVTNLSWLTYQNDKLRVFIEGLVGSNVKTEASLLSDINCDQHPPINS